MVLSDAEFNSLSNGASLEGGHLPKKGSFVKILDFSPICRGKPWPDSLNEFFNSLVGCVRCRICFSIEWCRF